MATTTRHNPTYSRALIRLYKHVQTTMIVGHFHKQWRLNPSQNLCSQNNEHTFTIKRIAQDMARNTSAIAQHDAKTIPSGRTKNLMQWRPGGGGSRRSMLTINTEGTLPVSPHPIR